ncbi:MAG: Fic family protein [Planctomycetes bacterium]|jgi:Fic family protein|nr:Fic family protein [Planctomycetota bacterium]MBT4561255.1 Fic family protein [Planctomycetota bacterium]MBT5102289.1 Fic family protein [Planctomycetota bacterium]MBT5119490.1 Fic family protein [Planctomycetota bacterium]MBT7318195.1 Fic family protein [Planctomycetota bacterium]
MPNARADVPDWRQEFIESPDLIVHCLDGVFDDIKRQSDSRKRYSHWRKFKHLTLPAKHSPQQAWAAIKMLRRACRVKTPFVGKNNLEVLLCITDPLRMMLREIDLHQRITEAGMPTGASQATGTYALKSLLDEAYFSSRLEGADTTRRAAINMLRTKREPQTKSERMIMNNYRALNQLAEWADEPMTPQLLLHIQQVLTENTLDDPTDVGQFREDNNVKVADLATGETLHQPPPFKELDERIQRICKFANQSDDENEFIHPIVRAILLHFQIAYDHPFGDGNGRTARWVFWWSLVRLPEYRWMLYLPISRIIEKSRESYYQAFLNVESDELDATYLIRHQVGCVLFEMDKFALFLERRAEINDKFRRKLKLESSLNARQLALVDYLSSHIGAFAQQLGHAEYHGVTTATAGRDLNEMVALGVLKKSKQGKVVHYKLARRVSGAV